MMTLAVIAMVLLSFVAAGGYVAWQFLRTPGPQDEWINDVPLENEWRDY